MKLLLGFLVAFGIGSFCRLARIPSPAPQAILGAVLVVTMSVGYVVTGQLMARLQGRGIAQMTASRSQENQPASRPVQPVR
jgi:XapX domain-containing protein